MVHTPATLEVQIRALVAKAEQATHEHFAPILPDDTLTAHDRAVYGTALDLCNAARKAAARAALAPTPRESWRAAMQASRIVRNVTASPFGAGLRALLNSRY